MNFIRSKKQKKKKITKPSEPITIKLYDFIWGLCIYIFLIYIMNAPRYRRFFFSCGWLGFKLFSVQFNNSFSDDLHRVGFDCCYVALTFIARRSYLDLFIFYIRIYIYFFFLFNIFVCARLCE
jgi:hypothetical protein